MRFATTLLFLLCLSTAFGQKYSFVTFSTREGLPQTQVHAICQDDDGYLWVSTLGGLARFNGGQFTPFSKDDGLFNNRTSTLSYFDKTLWIGHDGGISYMKNGEISEVGLRGDNKSKQISDIVKFKKQIIVCSNGGGLFRLKGDSLEPIAIDLSDDEQVNEEYQKVRGAHVINGNLYLATRGGILKSNNGTSFKLEREIPAESFSDVLGTENKVYFISYSNGVYMEDLTDQSVTVHSSDLFQDKTLAGGYLDSRGNLWMNTLQEGVVLLKNDKSIDFIDTESGLPTNSIRCIYEDDEGDTWLGSFGKGVMRFSGETFSYFDISSGYPSELFLSGFQKPNGDFFLGTLDQGVIRIPHNGTPEIIDLDESMIWASVHNVDGKDWYGTQSSLVSVDEAGKKVSYDEGHHAPGARVTTFYKISDDEMYVGGSRGVSHYKNGELRKIGGPNDPLIGTARDFAEYNGKLICATNLGLFSLEGDKFEQYMGVENLAYCLQLDHLNQLWFGTEEGLYKIHNGKIRKVDLSKNPASNYINFLNFKNERLYVGTNNGLFVVSELNLERPIVSHFGLGEGLVDLETNLNSDFFDKQGDFWFGTASGLVCFHAESGLSIRSTPRVHLTSIRLNYEDFDYSKYSEELDDKGFPKHLVLPYWNNSLSFELDGISLSHHRGMTYQFLLEGLNDQWSPASENPQVNFNNLPAGDYKLRMRCVDGMGNTSDEIEISFTIREAFFKTWWFTTLWISLLVLLLILIFRFRLKRLKEMNEREKLEYKTRLFSLEQKSMNASMNRHFVFNSLNSIQYFINTQDRLSANKYLTNFAKLIRKNLDSANVEGNVISLEEELERMHLYLSLESMRFKGRFVYSIEMDEKIDLEGIKVPSMILQPFVENSIIHGILPQQDLEGKITVKVFEKDKYLNITIEDNGIGVSQSMSRKQVVDGDHKSQGMEITSKRIELIQKISNTDIALEGPSEIVDENGLIKGTYVLLKIPLEHLSI